MQDRLEPDIGWSYWILLSVFIIVLYNIILLHTISVIIHLQ